MAEELPDAEIVSEEESTTETRTSPRKDWKTNFNVKDMTEVEEVARLKIVAGVNEYKGQHLIFLAKVTDKDFSRQFFSMPAYVWEKAITALRTYIPRIAEIEKASMVNAVAKELARLKDLGISVDDILAKVE